MREGKKMREFFKDTDRSPWLDVKDKRLMWILTAVFTIVTLVNLGTLRFPQSTWNLSSSEPVMIDLGEEKTVSSIWINGNIDRGTLRFSSDDGNAYEYEQVYGEMFTWRKKDVHFTTRYIRLELVSGSVTLNEIALFDDAGNQLDASVTVGNGEGLMDEQSTVPEKPGYFNGMYFDEIYHARTAYEFLHNMSVYEWTHPPLGKIFIALGVVLFGMTPFGWRVMPALFGAGMLPILYILAKRLFRRRDLAFLGTALFALDTMHFAQTRIATVDVFIVFFILLMYLFMADYLLLDNQNQPLRKRLLPLGACGVSFGLGVASKWTGLYAGVGLALLFFANLVNKGIRSERGRERARWWSDTWKTILFCCIFFIVIPCVIYYLSYIPFYRYESARAGSTVGFRRSLEILIQQQESMYSYHSSLTATHPSQSAWYEWPFTARSVWLYYGADGDKMSNISTFGSPAVWWISAAATLCLLTEAICGRMKKDPICRKNAFVLLLVAVGANYLPWTLVPRCTFQYHFFPTVPFIILCGVLLVQHLEEERTVSGKAKWYWLAAAAVYFVLLLPACSGIPMHKAYAWFLEHVLPTGLLFNGVI